MKHLTNLLVITAIGSITFFFNACSTEFELNADYDAIPIIYGVLDQSVDTQFVKINKSFIGNGNNMEYAAINDSSLYTNVIGRVEERLSGALTATYNLEEMWVNNLEEGIFFTDSQKVYYFVPTSSMNQNAIYKLVVDVDEEAESIITETELIEGNALHLTGTFPQILQNSGLQLTTLTGWQTGDYLPRTIQWLTVENGRRYELALRFHFTEVTATTSQNKYIEWKLGTQEASDLDGGSTMSKLINGESFYEAVDNKLKNYTYEGEVDKRLIGRIEFIITAANDNLNTYIEINEPSTGVVTEKPIFTNIEGGVGIFASRFSYSTDSLLDPVYLDSHSSKALADGPITSGYKFCVYPPSDPHNILTTYPELLCP